MSVSHIVWRVIEAAKSGRSSLVAYMPGFDKWKVRIVPKPHNAPRTIPYMTLTSRKWSHVENHRVAAAVKYELEKALREYKERILTKELGRRHSSSQ